MKGAFKRWLLANAVVLMTLLGLFVATSPGLADQHGPARQHALASQYRSARGPAQAATVAPTAPGTRALTAVVPRTGAQNPPGGYRASVWLILMTLGIIIIVLLIALLARGPGRPVE